MKRIIWIFGQPGSGRTHVIDDIINNINNINKLLNIHDNKIKIEDHYYDRDDTYRYDIIKARNKTIYKSVEEFTRDDNEILIIKGQYCDYNSSSLNILTIIGNEFPQIEKEILYVTQNDIDIFYNNMLKTEWFQKNYADNIRKYPKEWLRFASEYMKSSLLNMQYLNYKFIEIDTLEEYKIIEDNKTMKL